MSILSVLSVVPKAVATPDLIAAAARIGCSVRQLRAVIAVEAAGSGFTTHRGKPVPKILFEPHKFYRHSGAYPVSRVAPHLSRRYWTPGTYNQVGGHKMQSGENRQHIRLEQAVALDERFNAGGVLREAALMSCSWGAGQVLGEHWKSLGYESVQAFVNAMYSEAGQIDAMARFIVTNRLADDVRRGGTTAASWAPFARGYNGTSYAVHNYHGRLASTYRRLG